MKFVKPYNLKKIADIIGATYVGDDNFPVLGINEIHKVEYGDLVFVDHPKYYDKALKSEATVVLINKKVECPKGKALIISDKPFDDFNKLTEYFAPFEPSSKMISESAEIGNSTHIQPGVFIGNKAIIGDNCLIHPNVVIYDNTIIGNNVIIHAGSVIGADAFYYQRGEKCSKMLSCGNVVIEDDVEIGALCTIDRGVTSKTIIRQGSKLDDHVHIGHDTIIGKKCLLAAQVGIAGCCVLEDEVTFWGKVGMVSNIRIGKKAIVLAKSVITKSLPGNITYLGYPAKEHREKLKEMAFIKRLVKDKNK